MHFFLAFCEHEIIPPAVLFCSLLLLDSGYSEVQGSGLEVDISPRWLLRNYGWHEAAECVWSLELEDSFTSLGNQEIWVHFLALAQVHGVTVSLWMSAS